MGIESILIALLWLAIYALVLVVVYWGATQMLAAFGAPANITLMVRVIFVLLAVLLLVYFLGRHVPALR